MNSSRKGVEGFSKLGIIDREVWSESIFQNFEQTYRTIAKRIEESEFPRGNRRNNISIGVDMGGVKGFESKTEVEKSEY